MNRKFFSGSEEFGEEEMLQDGSFNCNFRDNVPEVVSCGSGDSEDVGDIVEASTESMGE